MKRILLALALIVAGITIADAQGLKIVDTAGSNIAKVDNNGNLFVRQGTGAGATDVSCYIATVGAQATTAAILLSVEAPSSNTLTIERICTSASAATAAAAVVVTVRRTTTASSGGTALTNEGTGTTAVTKFDYADGNFAGIARLGGTPGTAGATIDQWGYTAGELGAGAADPPSMAPFCKTYGAEMGSKAPRIPAGVSNGMSVNVGSHGAGGLASGSISIEFCVR
jgi:hypothetical protein